MRKSHLFGSVLFAAFLACASISPPTAQETSTARKSVATDSDSATAQTTAIAQINGTLEVLAAELMLSISPSGTYAVKSANDATAGVPKDFLKQITPSLLASLMKASNSKIVLVDQTQIEDAWKNAVEFNGAEFEKIMDNLRFEALIVLHTRATREGIEASLQVVGATENSSGQVLASTKTIFTPLDWALVSGIDVENIDAKISALDEKIQGVLQNEKKAPLKANVTYSRYVYNTECKTIVSKLEDPSDPCSESITPDDKIVANVDGMKMIADPGIEGSSILEEIGWPTDSPYLDEIVWQGDFDNDGLNDVIIGSNCGGSGCPPIYRIVLYRGDEKFTTFHLRPLEDPNVEITPEGFHFVLRLRGPENFQESSTRANLLELEYRVKEGDLLEKNSGELSNPFYLQEFNVADAIENDKDMSCSYRPDEACITWHYDITGDGVSEALSCGYWSRWIVLTDCEIRDGATDEIYRLYMSRQNEKVNAQCKTISVLEEMKDGAHQLNCDFDPLERKLIPIEDSLFFENSLSSTEELAASTEKNALDGGIVGETVVGEDFKIKSEPLIAAIEMADTGRHFKVSGVASDDVLNIRSEPSSDSQILGFFSHDAQLVEVSDTSADGKWSMVSFGEGSGWVRNKFLAPQTIYVFPGTRIPIGLTCYTSEPETRIDFNDTTATVRGTDYEQVLEYQALDASIGPDGPVLSVKLFGFGYKMDIYQLPSLDEAGRVYPYSMQSKEESGNTGRSVLFSCGLSRS